MEQWYHAPVTHHVAIQQQDEASGGDDELEPRGQNAEAVVRAVRCGVQEDHWVELGELPTESARTHRMRQKEWENDPRAEEQGAWYFFNENQKWQGFQLWYQYREIEQGHDHDQVWASIVWGDRYAHQVKQWEQQGHHCPELVKSQALLDPVLCLHLNCHGATQSIHRWYAPFQRLQRDHLQSPQHTQLVLPLHVDQIWARLHLAGHSHRPIYEYRQEAGRRPRQPRSFLNEWPVDTWRAVDYVCHCSAPSHPWQEKTIHRAAPQEGYVEHSVLSIRLWQSHCREKDQR